MPNNLFNEQMTSKEARTVLFSAIEGRTQEEIKKIKDEYSKILPQILKREHQLAQEGWFID